MPRYTDIMSTARKQTSKAKLNTSSRVQKIINFFTPSSNKNEQRRSIRTQPEVETGDVNAANIMIINNGDQETRVIEMPPNIVPNKLNKKKMS